MLAVGIATAVLTGPGQTIGVAVFIDHLVGDLGLSRSEVSTAYLIGTLTGATMLPWVGRAVDRHGVRRAQVVVGVAFALALVNMSAVNGMVLLAIGFIGIRFLGQGSLSLVATVAVSISFTAHRGTALGIYATMTGALMALVPVVLSIAIDGVGWRGAWLLAAAVVLTLVVPLGWFGLPYPGQTIETPAPNPTRDPASSERDDEGRQPALSAASASPAFDRGEAMRTAQFWMLAAVSGTAGMLSTALNFHQIDLLGEVGLSATAAAALFGPQVIGSTLAGLSVGWATDRLGTRYVPAISMVLLAAAHWLAAAAAPGAIVIIYAVALGAAGGAIRIATSTLLPAWFGTAHLGAIQGALTLFGVAASAVGPVTLALIRSGVDSYRPAVLILSALPMAVALTSLGRRSIAPRVNRAPERAGLSS